MAPRRICIVSETYVPDVNGVANSLRQLIGALDPAEFQIQLIRTRPRSDWQPEVEEIWCTGMTIPMYPDLQIGLPCSGLIRQAWERFQPEIIYIATEGPLGHSALKQAQARQIPVLSAFHTNFHRYSSYYGLGWVKTLTLNWLRRFHNRTAATLVPSQEVADFLSASNFHNVQVLTHGVDCELFHPRRRSAGLRQQWGASADERVMLYVGRIAAEKNIPLAIEAYEQLKRKHAGLKLVMVGDGPLRQQIEVSHPDIIFAGIQTGEDLARHFASADLFVFPSLTETFGLVTLEALASGIAVAAFDMAAAHLHIRTGHNGALAEPDNNEAFIAAVDLLLQQDLPLLGSQARTTAEALSWGSVAQQFARLLEQQLIVSNKHSTAVSRSLV